MRETARRLLSWIVILTVVGTFLSKNVFDVLALESRLAEMPVVESLQAESVESAPEESADSGSNIEKTDAGQGVPDAGSENLNTEESDAESLGVKNPDGEGSGIENPDGEESGMGNPDGEESGMGNPDGENPGMENPDGGDSGTGNPDGEDSGEQNSDAENLDEENSDADISDAELTYVLYIIHTLRYTKDGEDMYIQELSQVQMRQSDFESGTCSLMRQAYDWEAVTASPGPGCLEYISIEDFEENEEGEKEYFAEIRYAVKPGWKVKFLQESSSGGAALFSIYEGSFDNIEFEKTESITLTIYYKYSNTGGLAGIDAHAPDVIVLPLKEDGTADLENWRVPHYEAGDPDYHGHSHVNLQGFRTVLNPDPLNEFLVNPAAAKNPAAYPDALKNGDFNLRPGVSTSDPKYQQAWDEARTTTVEGVTFTYIAPAENGGTAATTSPDADKQYRLNATGLKKDMSLTVYYRRAMGTYKVRYWKAGAKADGTDEMIEEKTMTGRIGALTNAEPLTEVSDLDKVRGYSLEDIAQKTIAPDGKTVVDVYYSAGRIRVIFNTNYIYIPRQQVAVNGNVDFSGIKESEMNAARDGYTFGGWQYEDKDGNRCDITPSDMKGDQLRLTSEFLQKANIKSSQETGDTSIQVLNLYPKWVEASTTVRVTFWTEDLNGQDVMVEDIYHDFGTGNESTKTREGYRKIIHEEYDKSGTSYTNTASFTMSVSTGTPLVNESGKPENIIEREISGNLSLMGTTDIVWGSNRETVQLSDFYEEQGIRILNGGADGRLAAADGSTQIYVFFARKEYTLDFVYYFLPEQRGESEPAICTETSAFYNNYTWPAVNEYRPDVSGVNAGWTKVPLNRGDNGDMLSGKVPRRTSITAKYGADLRDVWPGAEDVNSPASSRYILTNDSGGKNMRISWSTTTGIHNRISYGGNKNVPGAYSTMSEAIVADTKDNTKVHHLVAFWKNTTDNTYRYNYCYEVPDLDAAEVKNCPKIDILYGSESTDSEIVSLSDAEKERRNTLYLVPAEWDVFLKYGFSDLLTYDELALKDKKTGSQAGLAEGVKYYAVRIYNNKCYAVSRQLVALSAMSINSQNPSARPNLTLVNATQDHSTQLVGKNGSTSENAGYNTPDNPYDIYFYYTRDSFTITYMSNGTTEIGKITLPYGARLYGDRYNIPLEYKKKAGDYALEHDGYAAWSTEMKKADGTVVDAASFPVCPGRSEKGTRVWNFDGWCLSPSGSRPMEWEDNSRIPVVIRGNLRLYARWEKPSYRVEFDWNGGSIPASGDLSEEELKKQGISANSSFVEGGQIPRPVREGYILQGWQITHRGEVDSGGVRWIEMTRTDGALPEFHFDEPITRDLKVQAVWTPSGVAEISYTVFYQEKKTGNPVADPKKVTGSYRAGTVVWERPAVPKDGPYRNYVPLEQNKSITLDTVKENRLVFEYVEPSDYPYQVKFVERGTNKEILSYSYTTKSAALLVCPEKEQVNKLDSLGYWVVDDNGKPEENSAKLGKTVRAGEGNNPAAVFYVLPKEYEIRYTNLEVMGEEAEKELREKNPTHYNMESNAMTLNNPDKDTVYVYNGREYRFKGWRMERTEEIGTVTGETADFGDAEIAENVTIQPGSKGRLVFQAVWSPETYVVYFYPGGGGTFPNQEPVINFGGLESGTPLTGNVTVPAVTPKDNDAFIGWRWEEGADQNRLYTEKEIYAMNVESRDMHFVARYQSDKTEEPGREEHKGHGSPGNGGGPGNSDGPGDSDDSSDLTELDNNDTSENKKDRDIPQTGMLWWPVWLLGAAGVIMLAGGIAGKKSSGRRHEE